MRNLAKRAEFRICFWASFFRVYFSKLLHFVAQDFGIFGLFGEKDFGIFGLFVRLPLVSRVRDVLFG